jgi:hypothetical protein
MYHDEPLKFYHMPAGEGVNPNETWGCVAKERDIHITRVGKHYYGQLFDNNAIQGERFSDATEWTETLKETLHNIMLEYKKVIIAKQEKEMSRIDEFLNANRL